MTFAEWRTLVRSAYQGGAPTDAQLLRILVDGARSVMVRDVESDLALARSYENSFKTGKVRAAGTRMTASIGTIISQAQALMPIDEDTEAATAILENAITAARDEINDMADKWDAFLLQAAIDLQRHVPFYQVRQLTTFLAGGSGVTNDGFISRVALPDTARIQQLWYGHYYPALEADVEVDVDDIVVSNGRAYKIAVGGTPTIYDVATGFTSTDGERETLGDMVATYYKPERDWPVRQLDWNRRNQLYAGDVGVGPIYAFPPQADELWLYPALDADHRFELEWVGVTEDFEDNDEVLFDTTAAEAAAQYVRAMMFQTELDDARQASASLALYQRAVRKAVVDTQARETGSPPSVAPYDFRRRWRFCGACGPLNYNPGSGGMNINGQDQLNNSSGNTNILPTALNFTLTLNITGSASTRKLVLLRTGVQRGARLTVVCSLPTTADIVLDFRNGLVTGTQLLPTLNFENSVFTTDGVVTSATFDFYFDGTNWNYEESSIPS